MFGVIGAAWFAYLANFCRTGANDTKHYSFFWA